MDSQDESWQDLKIVICGGGIIGASTAYYLSKLGIGATIVERESVACAASGKAAGFLALDWCDSSPVGPLARKSFALHEELATELDTDVGYRKVHTLQVTANERGTSSQPTAAKGLPPWLDGSSITKAKMMGDHSSTAQVHPYRLTRALVDAAVARAGAKVVVGQVTGIQVDQESNRVTGVMVDGNVLPADRVVIAMGPWTGDAAEWLPVPPVTGTKAASILLRPKEPFTDHMLFTSVRTAAGQHLEPEVYPRPDGTVYICGATPNVPVPQSASLVQVLEESCRDIHHVAGLLSSRLTEAPVEAMQACYLPTALDGLPVIGALPVQGAYIASGHTCWGILNGPATGLVMAELITQGKAVSVDIRPFSPDRFYEL